jgi:hypothetical protein
MLRPRLLAFSVDGTEPRELALDIAAVPVDAVTVLDSWYHVIVHTGSHLASWVKQVCAHIRSLLSFMRFILVLTSHLSIMLLRCLYMYNRRAVSLKPAQN